MLPRLRLPHLVYPLLQYLLTGHSCGLLDLMVDSSTIPVLVEPQQVFLLGSYRGCYEIISRNGSGPPLCNTPYTPSTLMTNPCLATQVVNSPTPQRRRKLLYRNFGVITIQFPIPLPANTLVTGGLPGAPTCTPQSSCASSCPYPPLRHRHAPLPT